MLGVMIFVASLATPAVAFNLYSQYKYKARLVCSERSARPLSSAHAL